MGTSLNLGSLMLPGTWIQVEHVGRSSQRGPGSCPRVKTIFPALRLPRLSTPTPTISSPLPTRSPLGSSILRPPLGVCERLLHPSPGLPGAPSPRRQAGPCLTVELSARGAKCQLPAPSWAPGPPGRLFEPRFPICEVGESSSTLMMSPRGGNQTVPGRASHPSRDDVMPPPPPTSPLQPI